ncbi:hypothetical protein HAX54_011383, partial [Datura stramonium]|nr:hypothetical protein [Datura stramonium]
KAGCRVRVNNLGGNMNEIVHKAFGGNAMHPYLVLHRDHKILGKNRPHRPIGERELGLQGVTRNKSSRKIQTYQVEIKTNRPGVERQGSMDLIRG